MPVLATILIAVLSGGVGRELVRYLLRRRWGSNADLWQELATLQGKLATLQRENERLRRALDRETTEYRELVTQLRLRVTLLMTDLDRSRDECRRLKTENIDQQRQINELREHIRKLEIGEP